MADWKSLLGCQKYNCCHLQAEYRFGVRIKEAQGQPQLKRLIIVPVIEVNKAVSQNTNMHWTDFWAAALKNTRTHLFAMSMEGHGHVQQNFSLLHAPHKVLNPVL